MDQEVSRLLREAEERAVAMLNDHRDQLDWLASRLVENETVDGSVVLEVLHTKAADLPGQRVAPGGPAGRPRASGSRPAASPARLSRRPGRPG